MQVYRILEQITLNINQSCSLIEKYKLMHYLVKTQINELLISK